MPRTKGSTNKPKFILVKLQDLNSKFLPETLIEVSTNYKGILPWVESEGNTELVTKPAAKEPKSGAVKLIIPE